MGPEIHAWCGLGRRSILLPGVCALLTCVWDRSTQCCWPRAKGEFSAAGGSPCVKAGCGDPRVRRQGGVRGMLSAGPQLRSARAGRAGGSALVLLEARHSGSAGCWPRARIRHPEIVRASYQGLIASCAVPRACRDQCPGIGRAPDGPGRPGLTRGRGAAAAGRRRPRAVRLSAPARPPRRSSAPCRLAWRAGDAGARGCPAALPARPGPALRCLQAAAGEARPAPRGAAARGKGRPRQGLMPPHLSRPGRGGRGRRRSGAVTAAAPAPLPNR